MEVSDRYSSELRAQLASAAVRGMSYIVINVRDLQASFGDLTSPNDEMIACRLAMRSEMTSTDVLVVEDGSAGGMTVRYVLPREIALQ